LRCLPQDLLADFFVGTIGKVGGHALHDFLETHYAHQVAVDPDLFDISHD